MISFSKDEREMLFSQGYNSFFIEDLQENDEVAIKSFSDPIVFGIARQVKKIRRHTEGFAAPDYLVQFMVEEENGFLSPFTYGSGWAHQRKSS